MGTATPDKQPNYCQPQTPLTPATDHNNHADGQHHSHTDGHDHSHANNSTSTEFLRLGLSAALLAAGLIADYLWYPPFYNGYLRAALYGAALLPMGIPVFRQAVSSALRGDVFSEFLLMSIAATGAFCIQQYPEGVAVMLFYTVGELLQGRAVKRARGNIKALLDSRPQTVTVILNSTTQVLPARNVQAGAVMLIKAGEQLALDGQLLSENASVNTAALTGESVPENKHKGDVMLAGMVNLQTPVQVLVTAVYADSKLSKILYLVQTASAQKAPTELFIRRFARYYTPAVVGLALLICLLPWLFTHPYNFSQWLYRALVFMVISCPCALLISIPLGYFGGIGAASRHGILVKGGNYLDLLAKVKTLVADKTGTLTKGVFKVTEAVFVNEGMRNELIAVVNVLEAQSTHPVASAIHNFAGPPAPGVILHNIAEVPGMGLSATYNGQVLLAGSVKLLQQHGVSFPAQLEGSAYTTIAIALNNTYQGYFSIADEVKEDAATAIAALRVKGINTIILSGDKQQVVNEVGRSLGTAAAYGGLLPEDKVVRFKEVSSAGGITAFAGDGVNDAPVVALADVGIAMGGLGSGATIETADVVIQDDKPTKIPVAINIGKATRRVVWQNIGLAFGVKALVLVLGAGGIATMWEAVFADVGVALLAVLNAVRIQKMDFRL